MECGPGCTWRLSTIFLAASNRGRPQGRFATWSFGQAELEAVNNLVPETQKVVAVLKGRKTNTPRDAYLYIASLPAEVLAFIEVELPNPKALSKIRNYFQKWRPMRAALPGE